MTRNWNALAATVPATLQCIYDKDEGQGSAFPVACLVARDAILQLRSGRKLTELSLELARSWIGCTNTPSVEDIQTEIIDPIELGMCEQLTPDDGAELWACAVALSELREAIVEHERQQDEGRDILNSGLAAYTRDCDQ